MAEFKESEHPRDKDGKFTDKCNNSTLRNLTSEQRKRLLKALRFFSNNKKKRKVETSIDVEIPPFPKVENVAFQNGTHEKTTHHIDHAKELGYSNFEQYKKGAKEFWLKGDGEVYFSPIEAKFYKYDAKKQLLLVIQPDGDILTFYRPKNKQVFEHYKVGKRLKKCQK